VLLYNWESPSNPRILLPVHRYHWLILCYWWILFEFHKFCLEIWGFGGETPVDAIIGFCDN
jgi:hypothetical protein